MDRNIELRIALNALASGIMEATRLIGDTDVEYAADCVSAAFMSLADAVAEMDRRLRRSTAYAPVRLKLRRRPKATATPKNGGASTRKTIKAAIEPISRWAAILRNPRRIARN